MEHNLFVNFVLLHGQQRRPGRHDTFNRVAVPYNILAVIVFDEKAYATVEADCNL